MNINDTRSKLKNIIDGVIIEGATDNCTATRNILCSSFSTSTTVKRDFESKSISKKEQVEFLRKYALENALLIEQAPSESQFLARGGEAKVYFEAETKSVIKINDGIYYATWLEFFNSIVIHNLLFPNTAYSFLGFIEIEDDFFAVLKQPFVTADDVVDLLDVKKLLAYNGFENTLRKGLPTNNYYNKELGLILEDIHDENVIVKSNTLFFIDTVFYTAFQ
ncbi:putative polyvalent protein kinase domain-containing protein [Chitinophaga rhizophila]|uniref:Uncharacterized protein n=1 Tax=Chitinophaga rhizophila TaxID=2866212 RepID=A0ABS7G642_9BACT|nr:hypothetical protein [Chitinophaga rhizophila]MBW8683123.1 hypothetical protein [Chitinophaga rhizophila]